MTEGEITKICCLLLSLPQFRFAQQLPRQREPCFIKTENICDRRDRACPAIKSSLVKGAVVFRRKMTEGFLQNHIKSTLQSLRVAYGNPPLFTQGRLKLRLSLRFNIFFNLITTRNRVVAKQSRCEENTIVGNYFFIFYDMPHFVRRDIFAFAKVIL